MMKAIILFLGSLAFVFTCCQEELPSHYRIEFYNETLDAEITLVIAGDTVVTQPGVLDVTQAEPGLQSWTMHFSFPNPPYSIIEVGEVEINNHKRCTAYGEHGFYEYRWDTIE